MENQDIKRGIDFETRFGEESRILDKAFRWWNGERFNRKTLIFLVIIFIVNLITIAPLLGKNMVHAFDGSQALEGIAFIFGFLLIDKVLFYGLLTFFALAFAPLSYFLFVRRIVLRHELTAFMATMVFILPNPFFHNVPILVNALLNGDGAHVLVFAFIPLFLLYVQAFIKTGVPVLAAISSIGTALIAIFSPFAALNLIILYTVLTIAEGFLGFLRIKLLRLVFLFGTGGLLAFFWYYPTVMNKIIILDHVKYAADKFFSVAPLAIPAIPVFGALAFLIFDRRERLKPIFISLSLFLLYLALYATSNNLNITGIFTAERYLIELAFSSAMFLSILIVLLSELVLRNVFPKIQQDKATRIPLILKGIGAVIIVIFTIQGFAIVQQYAGRDIAENKYSIGVGEIKRVIDFSDITTIVASVISAMTLMALFYVLTKYPSLRKKRGGGTVMPS